MYLRAEHHDGWTHRLLSWRLEAVDGIAVVVASWHGMTGRAEDIFELDFPDTRILTALNVLAGLRAEYDGCTEDSPIHRLSVGDGSRKFATEVRIGFNWSPENKRDVDAFMSVWRPLELDVESLCKF